MVVIAANVSGLCVRAGFETPNFNLNNKYMNGVINFIKALNPRFWVGAVMCCFFGHKYRLKRHITPYLREIKCTRCKQEFGMNDQTQSVLPLDDELIELHRVLK